MALTIENLLVRLIHASECVKAASYSFLTSFQHTYEFEW